MKQISLFLSYLGTEGSRRRDAFKSKLQSPSTPKYVAKKRWEEKQEWNKGSPGSRVFLTRVTRSLFSFRIRNTLGAEGFPISSPFIAGDYREYRKRLETEEFRCNPATKARCLRARRNFSQQCVARVLWKIVDSNWGEEDFFLEHSNVRRELDRSVINVTLYINLFTLPWDIYSTNRKILHYLFISSTLHTKLYFRFLSSHKLTPRFHLFTRTSLFTRLLTPGSVNVSISIPSAPLNRFAAKSCTVYF